MAIKRMFEDDEFKILKRQITTISLLTYFGSVYVEGKASYITRRLTSYEKRYYFELLSTLMDNKKMFGTEVYQYVMHDFSQAIICRGLIVWQVYFEDSPSQKVLEAMQIFDTE